MRQAARNLAEQKSLEAKIRLRVSLFGQYLVGSGSYRQLIIGQDKRLRLELKLQVADQTTSLLQVSNGTTLWERRDMGGRQSLSYVNLRRVREAAEQDTSPGSYADRIAVGGLDLLLEGLDANFRFGAPTPQRIRDLPVWEVRGSWRAERLGDRQADEHLPDRVVVTLGRDQYPALFPYRIEFLRQLPGATPKDLSSQHAAEQSLVTIELFEVRNYRVDPRHFDFRPNDQQVVDRTDEYLARLLNAQGAVGDESDSAAAISQSRDGS